MVATSRKAQDIVNDWLDRNPNKSCSDCIKALQSIKQGTVKSAYYRYLKDHPEYRKVAITKKKLPPAKRNDDQELENTLQNVENMEEGKSSQNKQQKSPVSLSKKSPIQLAKEALLRQADSGNIKACEIVLTKPHLFMAKLELPPYERPLCFHKLQHELMDAIKNPKIKIIFCEGVQRAGKSSAVFCTLIELVIENYITGGQPLQFDLMAGKADQAIRIMRDCLRDKTLTNRLKDYNLLPLCTREMIPVRTQKHCIFFEGTRIDAHETTVSDIKGGDSNLAWIDEFDVALRKDKEAIMTAFLTMRAEDNLKIIMTANMDKGEYMNFRRGMQNDEDVKFISMQKQECPHLVTKTANDALLMKVGKSMGMEALMKRRLENIDTGSGDRFDSTAVFEARDRYDFVIAQMQDKLGRPQHLALYIDPSGTGHPFGWLIGARYDNINVVVECGMMQMGLDTTGEKWTPERINHFLLMKCRNALDTFGIKNIKVYKAITESNTQGPAIEIFLQQNGVIVQRQNFGKEGNNNSQESFITVANEVLCNREVVFPSDILVNQLITYDIEQKKKDGKFKGDIADCYIHFIWDSVKGLDYLREESIGDEVVW